jgi:LysM repeat protein
LAIGQVLTITAKKGVAKKQEPKKQEAKKQEPVYHVVQTKETKYGIAKQYGITVEELEKKNPEIVSGLQIGQTLLIKGERPKTEVAKTEVAKTETPKAETPKVEPAVETKPQGQGIAIVGKTLTTMGYTVQPKETLFSLSRQFNMTQEELIKMNPELKDGVREGMLIEVPVKPELKTVVKKELSDLTETIQVVKRN